MVPINAASVRVVDPKVGDGTIVLPADDRLPAGKQHEQKNVDFFHCFTGHVLQPGSIGEIFIVLLDLGNEFTRRFLGLQLRHCRAVMLVQAGHHLHQALPCARAAKIAERLWRATARAAAFFSQSHVRHSVGAFPGLV